MAWKKKPKRSRHQMAIEICMLEVERDRAVWECEQLTRTNTFLRQSLLTLHNLVAHERNLTIERDNDLVRKSNELLAVTETAVEDQFKRD